MFVKRLRLKNFRNYDAASVNFNKSCNILTGDNAQGKTNLLEALYMCAFAKSYRNNSIDDMVLFGNELFSINMDYENHQQERNIKFLFNKEEKKKYL